MSYFVDLYVLCLERDFRINAFLSWIQAPEGVWVEVLGEECLFEDAVSSALVDSSLEFSVYRDDSPRWGKWGIHFIGDYAVIFSIAIPWDDIGEDFTSAEIRADLLEFVNQTSGDFGYGAMETPPALSVRDFQDYLRAAPVLQWLVGNPSVLEREVPNDET